MLNPVNKVRKAVAADLRPDEQVVAATLVQPAGEIGRQIRRNVGGIAGAVLHGKGGSKRIAALNGANEMGIATTLPASQPLWLVLTTQRVLVWNHNQFKGKPKALVAELRRDQITGIEVEKLKSAYAMVVRFSDDSALDFDVPKIGGAARGFQEAFAKA